MPDDIEDLYQLRQGHANLFSAIGEISSAWSMLEFMMNQCIWTLAGINPVAGGCLTAQIYTITSRIDCLCALMKLRAIDEKIIGKLNKFRQEANSTQEKRNRLIHDPVIYDKKTRKAGKIEITAKGKPVFRTRNLEMEEVHTVYREILKRVGEFQIIHEHIKTVRDTLPEIPKPEADPMRVTLVLDTRN